MTINRRLLEVTDRAIPKTQREWSAFVRELARLLQEPGESGDQLSIRSFLPPPTPMAVPVESQVETVRAFLPPVPQAPAIEPLAVRAFLPPPAPRSSAPDDANAVIAQRTFAR